MGVREANLLTQLALISCFCTSAEIRNIRVIRVPFSHRCADCADYFRLIVRIVPSVNDSRELPELRELNLRYDS
jgi:hypothetical protein